MKKYIKLILYIVVPFLVVSCNEDDCGCSQPPFTSMVFNFYNKLDSQDLEVYSKVEYYVKDIKTKLIPTDKQLEPLEGNYNEDNSSRNYDGYLFPIKFNYSFLSASNFDDIDEFQFIVTHKDEEVYNKFLQIHYDYTNGQPYPDKIKFKNEDGEWELLERSRIPITNEEGEETQYEFEVYIPNVIWNQE